MIGSRKQMSEPLFMGAVSLIGAWHSVRWLDGKLSNKQPRTSADNRRSNAYALVPD